MPSRAVPAPRSPCPRAVVALPPVGGGAPGGSFLPAARLAWLCAAFGGGRVLPFSRPFWARVFGARVFCMRPAAAGLVGCGREGQRRQTVPLIRDRMGCAALVQTSDRSWMSGSGNANKFALPEPDKEMSAIFPRCVLQCVTIFHCSGANPAQMKQNAVHSVLWTIYILAWYNNIT